MREAPARESALRLRERTREHNVVQGLRQWESGHSPGGLPNTVLWPGGRADRLPESNWRGDARPCRMSCIATAQSAGPELPRAKFASGQAFERPTSRAVD